MEQVEWGELVERTNHTQVVQKFSGDTSLRSKSKPGSSQNNAVLQFASSTSVYEKEKKS